MIGSQPGAPGLRPLYPSNGHYRCRGPRHREIRTRETSGNGELHNSEPAGLPSLPSGQNNDALPRGYSLLAVRAGALRTRLSIGGGRRDGRRRFRGLAGQRLRAAGSRRRSRWRWLLVGLLLIFSLLVTALSVTTLTADLMQHRWGGALDASRDAVPAVVGWAALLIIFFGRGMTPARAAAVGRSARHQGEANAGAAGR